MIANKYILAAMSLLSALIAWATAFDWVSFTNARTGAVIIGVVASAKFVLNILAPAPGENVQATGDSMITHKTQS